MTQLYVYNESHEFPLKIAGDYYLSGGICALLRDYFSSNGNDRFPGTRDLVYVQNIAQGAAKDHPRSLKIVPWTEIDFSATNITPAIVLKENDCASVNIGMTSHKMSPTVLHSQEIHASIWAGSHTVFVISEKPALARLLAWEVATVLEETQNELRRVFGFKRIRTSKVGAVKPMAEFPQKFASPITIEYIFERGWAIEPSEPLLQHIKANTIPT
jgi:hypothetical protein